MQITYDKVDNIGFKILRQLDTKKRILTEMLTKNPVYIEAICEALKVNYRIVLERTTLKGDNLQLSRRQELIFRNLFVLYGVIDEYANDNLCGPVISEGTVSYFVKYKDVYFKIAHSFDRKMADILFVSHFEITSDLVIPFEYILEGERLSTYSKKRTQIDKAMKEFDKALKFGVPYNILVNEFNQHLYQLKNNQ